MQGRQERTFRWDWLCPVPQVGLVGQDSYVPDWSMKGGLLRLVKDISELRAPKGTNRFCMSDIVLETKVHRLTGETMGECTVR